MLRNETLTQMTSQILESHFIAGTVRNLWEGLLGRTRPYSGRGARYFKYGGGDSFPSGHASVVFEMATVVSHHTRSKPVRVLAYALATSLALQRIDAQAHWPSDVFIGAAIGTAVARAVVRRHEQREASSAAKATAPARADD